MAKGIKLSLESRLGINIRVDGRRPTQQEAIALVNSGSIVINARTQFGVHKAPDSTSANVERYIRAIADGS